MNVKRKTLKPKIAGCDTRRKGKVYVVTNMRKWLDRYTFGYFLKDPPIKINDPTAWGLCPQGISYSEIAGIYHAKSWVGEDNYPFTTDLVEEMASGWMSRLLPQSDKENLKKLIPGKSTIMLFHPKGYINNPQPYNHNFMNYEERGCVLPEADPNHKVHLVDPDAMCVRLWWQSRGKPLSEGRTLTTYKVGDISYKAFPWIEAEKPDFNLAWVAWLPIDEFHIVESDDKSDMEKALDFLADNTAFPVYITNL